ncbi:hypothetical protein LZF95_26480, partial [Algoriphagus sp. AGSA1]|nr:hypothetical protein [Algoriphagus sp. AGSA1]
IYHLIGNFNILNGRGFRQGKLGLLLGREPNGGSQYCMNAEHARKGKKLDAIRWLARAGGMKRHEPNDLSESGKTTLAAVDNGKRNNNRNANYSQY